VEQRQLDWLITNRSQVRVLPPQPLALSPLLTRQRFLFTQNQLKSYSVRVLPGYLILLTQMSPPEIYKLFGTISVAITGLAIAFMVYTWKGDKGITISQNAAANRSSYLMMLIVQSITLPMLFLFWSKWLVPSLELPLLFTIFAGLTCLGLLLAAWIPDIKGWKSIAHRLFAYGAAALVPLMLIMLYYSPHISSFAKYLVLLVFIYDVMTIVMFTILKKGKSKKLYFQASYIFFFALTTLAAAYI
jgi:hypothetical protein